MSDKTMDSYVDMIAKESVESMETGKAQNFNQDVELFGNKFPSRRVQLFVIKIGSFYYHSVD